MTDKSVSFHEEDDPAATEKYKQRIATARAKQKDRRGVPGPMEGTPHFDEVPEAEMKPPAGVTPREKLSDKTVDGLERLVADAPTDEQMEEVMEGMDDKGEPEENPPELTQEQKLRKAVEARLDPIDIGQYLSGGNLTQRVPIIPEKLEVVFRSVTDEEEVYVDSRLTDEGEMSIREFNRRSSEWALAMHVHSLNGTKWPKIFKNDETINEESVKMRMKRVRKLHTPLFQLLLVNMGWFMERANMALTLEALGNG